MRVAAFDETSMTGNDLMGSLPPEAALALAPHVEAVRVGQQETFYNHGDPVAHVYFPLDCVVAGVTLMRDGTTVETAMFGREGLVGVESLFAGGRANWWARALVGGAALRVRAQTLRALAQQEESLQALCLLYYSTVIRQVSRRVLCNTRHTLFERLCTWLLMVRDRARGEELPLTQETVSRQLGVRRAGVNEAAGRLQRMGLIEHSRGRVRVADRSLLEGLACLCYGQMKEDLSWREGRGDGAGGAAH